MPNVLITVPDTYEQVIRRVAVNVARHLAKIMRLPPETMVNIPGEAETTPMNGGSFVDCCSDAVKFPASTKLLITFVEEADESTTLTTAVKTRQNAPLFEDTQRDITIRPITRLVKMVSTIKYTGQNRVQVQRWIDELRTRFSAGRVEIPLDLEYHYSLPDQLHSMLMQLYQTANKSTVLIDKPFKDYFHEHTPVATTVVSALNDTAPRLVYVERQLGVLGWFDFQVGPPNPEKEGEEGAWSSSASFTIQYTRPHEFYARYPILVHNKVVPKKMLPQAPYATEFQEPRRVSNLKGLLDKPLNDVRWLKHPYVRVPDIDDWFVPPKIRNRRVFFTGLVQLKADDRRTLLDLSKLGDLSLHPTVLEFYGHKGAEALAPGKGFFEYTLYENNAFMGSNLLTLVDGHLLKTTVDLDLTRYYHVQISLVANWFNVARETLQCLRRYPTLFLLIVRALNIQYPITLVGTAHERSVNTVCPGEGSWGEHAITKGFVSQATIDAILRLTDDKAGNDFPNSNISPRTVMQTELLVNRITN